MAVSIVLKKVRRYQQMRLRFAVKSVCAPSIAFLGANGIGRT